MTGMMESISQTLREMMPVVIHAPEKAYVKFLFGVNSRLANLHLVQLLAQISERAR